MQIAPQIDLVWWLYDKEQTKELDSIYTQYLLLLKHLANQFFLQSLNMIVFFLEV